MLFYYYIIIITFHLIVVAYCIIIIAFHLSVVAYCIIIIAFHLSVVAYCIIIIAFHFSVVLLLHHYYCIQSQCCCIVTGPSLWHAENLTWMTDSGNIGETMSVVHEKVIDELSQKLASMKLSWRSPQDSAEMDIQLQSASTALSSYEVQQLLCVTLPCHVFVALFLTDVLCVCDDVNRLCSDCPC